MVYIQKPIKRPEYVLEYLGRFTHRQDPYLPNHLLV
ncbi:MAG: hypothetical protein MUP98_06665 [Candidatus Aminicenantes bacterium]|nr:hypothetical protein [Candidatus Aminicenantes bacterium]